MRVYACSSYLRLFAIIVVAVFEVVVGGAFFGVWGVCVGGGGRSRGALVNQPERESSEGPLFNHRKFFFFFCLSSLRRVTECCWAAVSAQACDRSAWQVVRQPISGGG